MRKRTFVVLYLSSTSNHNTVPGDKFRFKLCYIFLLHQTTTNEKYFEVPCGCVISFFYIKPQQQKIPYAQANGCVISFFYIKPQHCARRQIPLQVVLYLSSTSNHNTKAVIGLYAFVVLYLSSTSNHNASRFLPCSSNVVLYLSSTSNHNYFARQRKTYLLCYIFLLHQTTTR